MRKHKKHRLELLIALGIALPFLFPVLFVLACTTLSEWEASRMFAEMGQFTDEAFMPLRLPPVDATLNQYTVVLTQRPQILTTFFMSVGYLVASVGGMLLVAPLAAFVFAKGKLKGRDALFFVYVVCMLLPFQVLCVPQYLQLDALGLTDSPLAIVLPEVFSPLCVFLLRQFMKSIPNSVLEAAELDGAGALRRYLYIVLPLSKPALAVAALLSAAKCWNLIEQPLLFLKTPRLYPLSLYIHEMMGAQQVEFFVACILAVVPLALLFLLLNDEMRQGLQRMDL